MSPLYQTKLATVRYLPYATEYSSGPSPTL